MTETAQPETAAESEVASDPFTDAANAFKSFDPNAAPTEERLRDEHGRFKSAQEIEAEDEAEQAETEAESHDEVETDEAADEAQPEAVDLPTSWPAEHGEMWNTLPAEAQAFIRQRDAEQAAAVNAKFQEAANVRKANEALVTEAQANRQRFVEATDFVLSMVAPQKPSPTMLNPQSGDYNPDSYHLQMAQFEQANDQLRTVMQHREQAVAQQQAEAEAERAQRVAEINEKALPTLTQLVPEFSEGGQKAEAAFMDLARYALEQGVPAETSLSDFNAVELAILAKARKWDAQEKAKAKVQPKAAKPAAPVVKPGVTTPRSAVESAKRAKAFDRLDREGSIEAAAEIFKLSSKVR